MSDYKVYVLVLCIIVYVALTALFSVLITVITKQSLKLVRLGVEDDKIKTEYFNIYSIFLVVLQKSIIFALLFHRVVVQPSFKSENNI